LKETIDDMHDGPQSINDNTI